MLKAVKYKGLLWTGVVLATTLAAACSGSAAAPTASQGGQPTPPTEPTAIATTPAIEPTTTPAAARTGNQVGDRVPEFTINLLGGESRTTSQLMADGKPAFLFFMAVW